MPDKTFVLRHESWFLLSFSSSTTAHRRHSFKDEHAILKLWIEDVCVNSGRHLSSSFWAAKWRETKNRKMEGKKEWKLEISCEYVRHKNATFILVPSVLKLYQCSIYQCPHNNDCQHAEADKFQWWKYLHWVGRWQLSHKGCGITFLIGKLGLISQSLPSGHKQQTGSLLVEPSSSSCLSCWVFFLRECGPACRKTTNARCLPISEQKENRFTLLFWSGSKLDGPPECNWSSLPVLRCQVASLMRLHAGCPVGSWDSTSMPAKINATHSHRLPCWPKSMKWHPMDPTKYLLECIPLSWQERPSFIIFLVSTDEMTWGTIWGTDEYK